MSRVEEQATNCIICRKHRGEFLVPGGAVYEVEDARKGLCYSLADESHVARGRIGECFVCCFRAPLLLNDGIFGGLA